MLPRQPDIDTIDPSIWYIKSSKGNKALYVMFEDKHRLTIDLRSCGDDPECTHEECLLDSHTFEV